MKPSLVSILLLCAACIMNDARAQVTCPPNIGFENGSFLNWQCSSGGLDVDGTLHLLPSAPGPTTHVLFTRSSPPQLDYYGQFPKLCPNGSGYSVRLGNDSIGARAEGLTYTFTVPPGANEYSIIYNYAVVFENPHHVPPEQPKFTVKVFDVAAASYIDCSSAEFVSSLSLPGFYESSRKADVLCKNWSAVTIHLKGYAGKTLKLEFTNNDCSRGAHFGYVYLDVNENCEFPIAGTGICKDDNIVTLTAPFGFSSYKWYNESFSSLLGTNQSLTLFPAPAPNERFAVVVYPYLGLGCQDTLIATIRSISDTFTFRLADTVFACKTSGADLTKGNVTAGSSPGLLFSYHPDPAAAGFIQDPSRVDTPGVYYIKATTVNGCKLVKPVSVRLLDSPLLVVNHPPPVVYPATVNITLPSVIAGSDPMLLYGYFDDAKGSVPLSLPAAIPAQGTYYIKGTSPIGCINIRPVNVIINPPPPYQVIAPNVFSPNADGINDRFRITVKGEVQLRYLYIYNRWGALVGKEGNVTMGWDGNQNGSPLPAGAYYWLLEGYDLYWKKSVYAWGLIMLLR
jgi:gliding motility-associated-like protein